MSFTVAPVIIGVGMRSSVDMIVTNLAGNPDFQMWGSKLHLLRKQKRQVLY
jgi:hypothetical protein